MNNFSELYIKNLYFLAREPLRPTNKYRENQL